MKIELFPFQKTAVENLRYKVDQAIGQFRNTAVPQVVSLQAPTGSGKTVMMTAFIESVLFGDDRHDEKPNAVFVWLSDSPALNQQSKDKIDTQSDKILFGQTVIVEDASFDRETFDDGHIYFINTQKLSKAGNLGRKSDARQWTIWQTIQNTIEQKADRLYFIIDEAHRGMQGNEGGKQTAIMQRFLKGWAEVGLSPVPVAVGMSATPERFNKLVGTLNSTIQQERVSAEEVRASGLLKDRIIITYPEDPAKQDDIAVLVAATREWMDKCEHWQFYCATQHYKNVNPVFVIQVKAGTSEGVISETDLDAALGKISETYGKRFEEGEVVHTFGSVGDVTINGIAVKHVDPSEIAADRKIKVVFFKENLSTGWDCPRAETMMSFRRAEDYTYIAQLLGRMIRTPLQCHVNVDDSLNDVKLYLPYFDAGTVDKVIEELKASECGEIPAYVGSDFIGSGNFVPWGTKPRIKKIVNDPNQLDLFVNLPQIDTIKVAGEDVEEDEESYEVHPQPIPIPKPIIISEIKPEVETEAATPVEIKVEQPKLQMEIDRQDIIKRINQMDIIRFNVRTRAQHIQDYLSALLRLSSLLTRTQICSTASKEVKTAITSMMHESIQSIKRNGLYEGLAKKIREMKLESKVFDAFGDALKTGQSEFAFVTENDIDRQLREADTRLGRAGIVHEYGRRYAENEEDYKIDAIIFSRDEVCMKRLYDYAKDAFHRLNDDNRKYVYAMNDRTQDEYNEIIASGDVVSKLSFVLPETIQAFTDGEGKTYSDHLYADNHGYAKVALDSSWEEELIEEEQKGADFVCWLRNQSRAKWALCIPYEVGSETHAFYPDMLTIRRDYNPKNRFGYIVDILEPHSDTFADNLAKAKGLARYAAMSPQFGRVQLIRKEKQLGGGFCLKRLDMAKGEIRQKVLEARDDETLDWIFSQYAA